MSNRYKVKEIIAAVDLLLEEKEGKLKLVNELRNPKEKKLRLVNEIKDSKKKLSDIPKNTEKIILQAERYLKK
tara:strand:- start:10575 stop:10793 length:219 start_codon:yes stop_codon:yes gene_type:complete